MAAGSVSGTAASILSRDFFPCSFLSIHRDRDMKKYFLIFFMIVGAGDFLYGVFSGDQLSILMGAVIMILTIYIARRKKTENDTKSPSSQ